MTRLRSAYALSLVSFGVKGVSSLFVTYLVANGLSVAEFGLWSTMFSLGIVFSVADFGVGQLIVTRYHEGRLAGVGDRQLLTKAVLAMALFAGVLLIFGSFAVQRGELARVNWKPLLLFVIVMRLVLIPYGAVLAAHAKYHERKAIEAIAYAVGGVFILVSMNAHASVSVLLMGMNVAITAGSVGIAVRARSVADLRPDFSAASPRSVISILRESLPYFLHNLSGLAVYGGFVAATALVLTAESTARVALLHSILFMNLFQVFDLIFRTVQTELHKEELFKRLKALLAVSYLGLMLLLGAFGSAIIGLVFRKYSYSQLELLLYVTFVFSELYYLLLTSRLQMKSSQRAVLQNLAIVKTTGFMAALGLASLLPDAGSLSGFASFLCLYSLAVSVTAAWFMAGAGPGIASARTAD
jgi:O-antigen/teichoic acid export membrane protein